MKGMVEKWFPLLISTMVSSILYALMSRNSLSLDFSDVVQKIFPNTITLGGIVIGFLTASKSILFAIDSRFIVKQIKKAGNYEKLVNYFMDAINWSFILVFFSMVGLVIDFSSISRLIYLFFLAWFFSLSITALSSYRVIRVFSGILKDPK